MANVHFAPNDFIQQLFSCLTSNQIIINQNLLISDFGIKVVFHKGGVLIWFVHF